MILTDLKNKTNWSIHWLGSMSWMQKIWWILSFDFFCWFSGISRPSKQILKSFISRYKCRPRHHSTHHYTLSCLVKNIVLYDEALMSRLEGEMALKVCHDLMPTWSRLDPDLSRPDPDLIPTRSRPDPNLNWTCSQPDPDQFPFSSSPVLDQFPTRSWRISFPSKTQIECKEKKKHFI